MGAMLPTGTSGQADPTYSFKVLTFREGLSHSRVSNIVQDSLGYVWLGTENGLNRFDGTEIVVFKHVFNDTTSLPDNSIRKVFLDSQQRMWLITASGVCRYRPTSRDFRTYPFSEVTNHEGNQPLDIVEGPGGQIFVLSYYNTVSVFSEERDCFEEHLRISFEEMAQTMCLYQNRLFVGTPRFLLEIAPFTGQVIDAYELYDESHPLSSRITQLTAVADQLWIAGTMMHLHRFDPISRTLERIEPLPYSASVAPLTDQVLLVGTYEGCFLYRTDTEQVLPLRSVDYESFLNNIVAVFVDRDRNLWAANRLRGVIRTTGERVFRDIRHLNPDLAPFAHDVSALQIIDQQLWMGLNTGQVLAVDLENHQYQRFGDAPDKTLSPGEGTVFDIAEDRQQRVWVGSYEGGLRRYDAEAGHFVNIEAAADSVPIRGTDIRSIAEDANGRLWLAVHGRGVDVYDPASERVMASHGLSVGDTDPYISDWTLQLVIAPDSAVWIASPSGIQMIKGSTKRFFQHHNEHPKSLSNDDVNCLLLDSRNNLWVGTAEGLNLFNPEDASFTKFTVQQNLSDDHVTSLLEDASGNLWVGTYDGLSRLSYDAAPEEASLQRVELPPGLYSHQFVERASALDSAGNLYFATTHGLLTFNPADFSPTKNDLAVFLTAFEVFRASSEGGQETQPVASPDRTIYHQDRVALEPNENTVSIGFSAIDFAHSGQIHYHYRLRGYEHRWSVGTNRNVTYYDLPAGDYVFEVKAALGNATPVSASKLLAITIKPAWYDTLIGRLVIAILLLGLTLLGTYLLLERIRLKNQARLSEKEREVDQLKIRFFVNVSHEFRTPLTLILGPLEKLIRTTREPDARQHLSMMQRNTKRLLRLTNQVLDLRQLEQQRYQLHPTEGRLVDFVRETYYSFHYLAEQRAIEYRFKDDTQAPRGCWFDADVLDKILYNIISNAFKYTPDGGRINVTLSHHPNRADWVVLKVSDTGVGIEAEQLDKIFDRFYRVDATAHRGGTGIGLSLCQELTRLHRGEITVVSHPNQGSTFTLTIPTSAHAYELEAVGPPSLPKESHQRSYRIDAYTPAGYETGEEVRLPPRSESDTGQKPLVLVVDDNTDLLLFVQGSFAQDFTIATAPNGQEAFQTAVTTVPDAIVSDVMMPVMDGLALVRKLKEDVRTSHIPVILLTARTSEQHHLEGLRLGIDDYVTKPFGVEVLTAKLHSLISNRAKLRELFANPKQAGAQRLISEGTEHPFLRELTEIIDQNMDATSLGTDTICQAVGMSRSQLYRKLSAITGKSLHEFIKLYRLARAADLLCAGHHSVTEVANLTGFKYIQSFTRSFKDHYGCTPSQYARSKVQSH